MEGNLQSGSPLRNESRTWRWLDTCFLVRRLPVFLKMNSAMSSFRPYDFPRSDHFRRPIGGFASRAVSTLVVCASLLEQRASHLVETRLQARPTIPVPHLCQCPDEGGTCTPDTCWTGDSFWACYEDRLGWAQTNASGEASCSEAGGSEGAEGWWEQWALDVLELGVEGT